MTRPQGVAPGCKERESKTVGFQLFTLPRFLGSIHLDAFFVAQISSENNPNHLFGQITLPKQMPSTSTMAS